MGMRRTERILLRPWFEHLENNVFEEFEELDCELCETDWFLGRPGTCDFEEAQCICPKGFSGVDDSFVSETCYVNVSLAMQLHVVRNCDFRSCNELMVFRH